MRLRITFSKSGALRYSGHLDLVRIWERSMRRAGIPLAYTQGFHPGPKIQLACALPLGFGGRAEIVDMLIDGEGDENLQELQGRLQQAVPPGLVVSRLEVVDARGPALQTQVVSAEYELTLPDGTDFDEVAERVAALLKTACLPRQRRGKSYDLRPLVENLELLAGEGSARLGMRLAAREGATGRPEEVLDALGIPLEGTGIERIRLILREAGGD